MIRRTAMRSVRLRLCRNIYISCNFLANPSDYVRDAGVFGVIGQDIENGERERGIFGPAGCRAAWSAKT